MARAASSIHPAGLEKLADLRRIQQKPPMPQEVCRHAEAENAGRPQSQSKPAEGVDGIRNRSRASSATNRG